MKKIAIALALLATVPAQALASDQGVYLEANIGAAKYTDAEPFPDPGKFSLGVGYKFNKNFAADVGFTVFGDSTVEVIGVGSATLKAHSFHPSIVGILPFTREFSAFGKFGFSRNQMSGSDTFGNSFDATKTSPYFALGLEYDINPKLGFRAIYENYGKFATGGTAEVGASAFSMGIIVYLQ